MKLHCSVVVIDRQHPTINIKTDRKYKNATLAVMKPPKESVVYILLITPNNKTGFRYKIKGNIEKTFGQFRGEGKSTIRFKEPPHDLCITADQIPLKNFMLVVKKIWSGEEQHVPEILNEKCIPQIKTSVTKMDIQRKGDYPTLKGFPSTLQILNINDCFLKKIDTRIFKLKNLNTLCLDRNSLITLPPELGLVTLKKLSIANNKLTNNTDCWKFISGPIASTLEYFDISNNKIGTISASICRLASLRMLKLAGNNLKEIPFRICLIPRLSHLDLSKNEFKSLPGSISRPNLRKLDTLDVSNNPDLIEDDVDQISTDRIQFVIPSLLELAARSVLDNRINYDEETVPWNLVPILDHATMCHCGKSCLRGYGIKIKSVEAKSLANIFISTSLLRVISLAYYACRPQHL